jgi:hypothetical protein
LNGRLRSRRASGASSHRPEGADAGLGRLDPADVARVASAFVRATSGLPPALRSAGERLFDRLASPNWTVEWGLPRWVGESRGLSEWTCARLVEANVLGLGYVRLADDARDGEAGPLEHPAVRPLADYLYSAAIGVYESLIGHHPWFWGRAEQFLAEWRMVGRHLLTLDALHADDDEILSLAHIGSPLQIGVAAVCAFAHQERELARLTLPVRRYLAATVLLDHMADWREDVGDGRPNLFVRALLGSASPPGPVQAIRRQMAEAMLEPQRAQAFLERVIGQLRLAVGDCRRASLDKFADALTELEARTVEASGRLDGEIRSLLRRAADIAFSPLITEGSPGAALQKSPSLSTREETGA